MNSQTERHQEEHRPAVHNPIFPSGGEHAHDDDDEQHEKKSVLKKVKAKAKKIKDTITKHGHGHETPAHHHDVAGDYEDDDHHHHHELEVDPEVHAAPIYESKEVRAYVPGQAGRDVNLAGSQPTADGAAVALGHHGTHSHSIQHDAMLGSAGGTTKDDAGHHGPISTQHDPLLDGITTAAGRHRTNIADADSGLSREEHNLSQNPHAAAVPHTDVGGGPTQPASHSLGYTDAHEANLPVTSGMGGRRQPAAFPQKTGILDTPTALQPDPHAPRGDRQPDQNYQTKVKDPSGRGGEEMGITPILHSLDKMTVYDTHTGSHDQFSPEPISSETSGAGQQQGSSYTDKAIQAKNAIASKLGYGGEGEDQETTTHSHESGKTPSSVTDYGKKVASTVYDKVAGAGGAVMSKMPTTAHKVEGEQGPDKGASTKEYIAEKVSPGEEDKALSEVISGGLHKANEDEKKAEPRGKVTFSTKVARQLGSGGEESVEDLGSGVSGPAGGTMVDKLKDTVTSWLGIGGETEPSSLVWHDIPKDTNEGLSGPNQEQQGQGTDQGKPRLQ